MIRYDLLQILLLVNSISFQAIGMLPVERVSTLGRKMSRASQQKAISSVPEKIPTLDVEENLKYKLYRNAYIGFYATEIALSNDNARILTSSDEGKAFILDTESGQVLKVLEGHTGIITSVALSADGTIALTGSMDKTARVWNVLKGETTKTIQVGSFVSSVALSAVGSTALIGTLNHRVRFYNTNTGQLLKKLKGHTVCVTSVALNDDGMIALTGSHDKTIRVWNTLTGDTMRILDLGSYVYSVALSADESTAVIGINDKRVMVLDVRSGVLLNTLVTDGTSVNSVAVSKDGKKALTKATGLNTVQVWNTKPLPGKKETTTPLTVFEGRSKGLRALALGSSGVIATASDDKTALIWKPLALERRGSQGHPEIPKHRGSQERQEISKHRGSQEHQEIPRQAYKETFSRSMLRPAKEKEIEEGLEQRIEETLKELQYTALTLLENPEYEVYKKFDVGSKVLGIALNADNTRALTGSGDNIARIWDIEKGTVIQELKGHTKAISSVALSADCTLALTGSLDGTTRVWDILTGKSILLQAGSISSVGLSADGTVAFTGSVDGIARLYNTSTGEPLQELKGHNKSIVSVGLSTDGTLALTGSLDGTAYIWDLLTGKSIILQANSPISSVALSADGTIALTESGDSKVLVWDAKSGVLLNTLLINSPDIQSIALSKDGKKALVGTHDNKIQVWNTQPFPEQKETSIPLTVLEAHKEPVTAVAFGNADYIASGSLYNNTALIWKLLAS